MKSLRIVFFGTPEFAVPALEALVAAGHQVVGVVTAADKPAGRGHRLRPSAVKQAAQKLLLNLMQPEKLRDPEFLSNLSALNADVFVVVAFRMLPRVVWEMPPMGSFNLHASLLPQYRGAAPVNHALLNGESETGVTVFKLQHEIDMGHILLQQRIRIGGDDDFGTLYEKLRNEGAALMVESLNLICQGKAKFMPQPQFSDLKTAPKISKELARIRWNEPSAMVRNRIRAMSPIPGAFTELIRPGGNEIWKIFRAAIGPDLNSQTQPGSIVLKNNVLLVACCDGSLELQEVQLPGKRRMPVRDLLTGLRDDLSGMRFH